MLITFVTSIETMDSLHSPESSILALKLFCFLHDHKPFVLYIITGCHVPSCTASALDKRPARKRDTVRPPLPGYADLCVRVLQLQER